MPASLKLLQQYGDDLQVLFVESQGASSAEAAAFALRLKWLGVPGGLWTIEHPCDSGSRGLPSAVLLDSNGKVVFKGDPLEGHKQILRLVDADIAARHSAPADAPKPLEPAWKAFGKGKYGEALKLVDALSEKDRSTLGDAWSATRAEFRKRIDAQLARAKWELENGYPTRCVEHLEALAKACEGSSECKASVEELRTLLAAPAGSAEREAAKLLERLEQKFYETGGDPAARKALERAVEKSASTKVAGRLRGVLTIGAP
ncbi:MAG: hypothetical protein IPJ19_02645 [Planctomycetes bacterium]|nr:hypothetical protein [Planctomycetota bacterium]